jgi:hypothetical protein
LSLSPKALVDTSSPHPARVYDYLLGGKDNYPVDRRLGERMPEKVKLTARQNRAFMHRSVEWVARQGIDQYLDIGTGIPTEPNLHQIVQAVDPTCRVVYTDNDPIVLRHAEALLVSKPQGETDYLQADIRDPANILAQARERLDFERPMALSLVAIMHFIVDEQQPYEVLRALIEPLASGSYLILSHSTTDGHPDLEEAAATYANGITSQVRGRAAVERFFDGLDLVGPGLVTAPEWFIDEPVPPAKPGAIYAGVARVR